MGIGLSGMVSGLDTDAIVKALMGTQREKSTKIENKITTNEWKIEKWKDLNSKIYSLYTGSLYKMKTQGNYLTKTTSSSNEKLVTATASSIAALGTHSVKVISTASAQYVTGKELDKEGLTSNSKLSEAGVKVGTIINITCGDKSERLEVKEDTTVSEFITACKDAGLNANFDTTRNRFYISSKRSGKDNAFSITTETFSDADLATKHNLESLVDYSALSDENQTKVDEAIEIIRNATPGTLEGVLEQLKLEEKDRKYSTEQLNVLSAYNTIQTIAKDSVASKLALEEVQENIRKMIKEDKGTKTVYGISYTEAAYKSLESSAATTANAEWTQDKFEEIYGNTFKDAGVETQVDYKYIQELTAKVSKIENNSSLGLTLTAEEVKIWETYTESKTTVTDTDENGAPITVEKTRKELFDAETAKLKEETKPEDYKAIYDAEFKRLVELDVKYYYKNSTAAQAEFESIKKQYLTEVDDDTKRPENMKTEDWEKYQEKWQERYDALHGKPADPNDPASIATPGKLDEITEALKDYQGMTTTGGANGLASLGIYDIAFNDKGELQIPSHITADALTKDEGLEELQSKGMSFVYAADGEVEVDGAVYAADSNTITVNGLTLNLKAANQDEMVTITVTQDTDAVYNMVKDFVKEYNELLDELNEAYNADSARDYKPLTEEQKEAMSEKEIEKWENKIKDSLLRRDNTLNSLISSMRTCLSGSVEVDGKKYALSSFGICTGNYSEKGKLHIYGDSDDSVGAMYDDKLRAAIEENPDAVMEVLQGLSENLYNTISDKMKSTSLSSALTVYNDKKMKSEITTYKKELSALEKRLAQMEERYYKQFTAMEKALSQMNSSANSLASMLGTGTQ